MNHKIKGRKLGRTSSHLEAMLANQATSLFRYGRIKTTHCKCKELRVVAEKLITIAKVDSLHSRRKVARIIRDKIVLKKLFSEIAPEFVDRPGGYTRILKLATRVNDGAPISFIQLVNYQPPEEEK